VLLGAGIDVEVCHVREKGVSELKAKMGKSKNKVMAAMSTKRKTERLHSPFKEDQSASTRHSSDSKLGAKSNSLQRPIVADDSHGDGLATTDNHSLFKRRRTMSDSATFSAKRERLL
jgi:hypothetical protein